MVQFFMQYLQDDTEQMEDISMQKIGVISQLQVQRLRLKQGSGTAKRYDPAPIEMVTALVLTCEGVWGVGESGEHILDVHHVNHPDSRGRSHNSLSIGFSGHYAHMRARFGPHMTLGCGGENVIVQADGLLTAADLGTRLVIHSEAQGTLIALRDVMVAAPCEAFSRYALQDTAPAAAALKTTLQALDHGVRGFYATLDDSQIGAGQQVTIRPGDLLLRVVD